MKTKTPEPKKPEAKIPLWTLGLIVAGVISVDSVEWARQQKENPPRQETIGEHLAKIIPHGERCDGCPKADPHNLKGHTGDVFCHLMEEVMPNGVKDCGINDPNVVVIKESHV